MKNRLLNIVRSKYFLVCCLLAMVVVAVFLPELLLARPGGGHSYSGGGGSGGSGGGGGGSVILFELLFRLFLILPFEAQVVLVVCIVVGVIVYQLRSQGGDHPTQNYTKSSGGHAYRNRPFSDETVQSSTTKQQKINRILEQDETFSEILFMDFAHSMYHKFYTTINTKESRQLKPFLSDQLKSFIQAEMSRTTPREEVVVGNLQIYDIEFTNSYTKIIVDYNANYNTVENEKTYRHILSERWVFVRKAGIASADPDSLQKLACPNCGAPNDFNDAGVCNYCDTLVEAGQMNWMLDKIVVLNHQHYRTQSLGTYAPEVGTNSPTIMDPFLQQKGQQFINTHQLENPTKYWEDFKVNVVRATFEAMYKAWSDRDHWKSVRHLLSDRLFEANTFWVDLYKEKNYYNRLENIQAHEVTPVRITMDNHYESITVRVFASAIDYTEHESGRLIGGDKKNPRKFTEYWTFIRKKGVEKPADQFSTQNCPNCGAPADKMSDSAVCGYCGAKTNTGDFTWVLANIAQDEAYQG